MGRRTTPDREEQYQPLILDGLSAREPQQGRENANRRRRPRFYVEGQAEVIDGVQRVAAKSSRFPSMARASHPLSDAAGHRLPPDAQCIRREPRVKAQVKYLVDNLGMGVEFNEIRRGDRPLLSYVLSKLKSRRVEEFARVEVVSEPLATAV